MNASNDVSTLSVALDKLYSAVDIDVTTVLFLPVVCMVMAISIRVAPKDLDQWLGSDDAKRTTSLKMYWNSKSALIMASAVKAENLHLVEALTLTGLYLILMHERRLAEGWSTFRAAIAAGQAIGLHRDGTKLGLEPFMVEYRRRLWSYLVHADATFV